MARRTHIGKRKQRRGRRRGRARRQDSRGIVEQLAGPVWNRRLRTAVRATGLTLFALGCLTFLTWSQVVGRTLLALSLVIFMGVLFVRWREHPASAVARRRVPFLAVGFAAVLAGWIAFFTVDQELGLLLVVLGSGPITVLTLGATHDSRGGPFDGPLYGETESGG